MGVRTCANQLKLKTDSVGARPTTYAHSVVAAQGGGGARGCCGGQARRQARCCECVAAAAARSFAVRLRNKDTLHKKALHNEDTLHNIKHYIIRTLWI